MFFTNTFATLALAVTALAASIPRADDVTCGSTTGSSSTTSAAVATDGESWLSGTQTGEGTGTVGYRNEQWLTDCYCCAQLPTTRPAWVPAVSTTPTPTTLSRCPRTSSTTTRTYLRPFTLVSTVADQQRTNSGYSGTNPNNNPVCNKQITATCMSPFGQRTECMLMIHAHRPRPQCHGHGHGPLRRLRDDGPRLQPVRLPAARGPLPGPSLWHDLGLGIDSPRTSHDTDAPGAPHVNIDPLALRASRRIYPLFMGLI